MRRILAAFLSMLGVVSAAAQTPDTAHAQASSDLRSMVLRLSPEELGLTKDTSPGPVWGLVMETGMEGGYYTLVALADGTTSLYFSNGGGILGGGEHEPVRKAGGELLTAANQFLESAAPASSAPPPAQGLTTFYFLTFDGIRSYTAPEEELGYQRDRLSPVFHAAHAVITELRLRAP